MNFVVLSLIATLYAEKPSSTTIVFFVNRGNSNKTRKQNFCAIFQAKGSNWLMEPVEPEASIGVNFY